MLKKITSWIGCSVLPVLRDALCLCLACDAKGVASGAWLCASCQSLLPKWQAPLCVQCGIYLPIMQASMRCGVCLKKPPAFDRMHAVFPFEFPISDFLYAFKFKGQLTFAERKI